MNNNNKITLIHNFLICIQQLINQFSQSHHLIKLHDSPCSLANETSSATRFARRWIYTFSSVSSLASLSKTLTNFEREGNGTIDMATFPCVSISLLLNLRLSHLSR